MGRVGDFAKRRIAGYVVFWIIVIMVVDWLYKGQRPTEASWLFVLAIAFTASLLFTRRMKRKQRQRRLTAEAPQRPA
ncbi:MAG: hypothetical protein A3K68_01145 [Euryarchaeota archaeon RBG_16_68_13]|nr:MAG: hypothetical protein A3K68_01145 [Euryarchaeota archaeon RBG_16_68_13]